MFPRGESGDEGNSSWSYSSLFWFGYFGADTPTGRRLRKRTLVALAAFAVANVLAGDSALLPVVRFACGIVMPVAVAYIVWAYVRYLTELDELSRLIQLQALAFSYGAVMTLAAARLGLAVGGFTLGWSMNPTAVFLWLLVAEALRGAVLVYLARKRQ